MSFFLAILCYLRFAFSDVESGDFAEIAEWFADSGVWVIEVVIKFAEFFSVEANRLDADLEKAGDNVFDTVAHFGGGFIVSGAVDFGDRGAFVFAEGFEEIFGLLDEFFGVGGGIKRNDDEEGFVHNVGFLGENVDKVDVIVHEDAEEHVVVIAADVGEAFDVGADVDALGADENLGGEVEGVEEVLIGIFYAFALGFGHEVEIYRLTGDDGTKRAVFHDDHGVANFGDE